MIPATERNDPPECGLNVPYLLKLIATEAKESPFVSFDVEPHELGMGHIRMWQLIRGQRIENRFVISEAMLTLRSDAPEHIIADYLISEWNAFLFEQFGIL